VAEKCELGWNSEEEIEASFYAEYEGSAVVYEF